MLKYTPSVQNRIEIICGRAVGSYAARLWRRGRGSGLCLPSPSPRAASAVPVSDSAGAGRGGTSKGAPRAVWTCSVAASTLCDPLVYFTWPASCFALARSPPGQRGHRGGRGGRGGVTRLDSDAGRSAATRPTGRRSGWSSGALRGQSGWIRMRRPSLPTRGRARLHSATHTRPATGPAMSVRPRLMCWK